MCVVTRVERTKVVETLTDAHELNGDRKLMGDRDRDAALRGAVELGQRDPGHARRLGEQARLLQAKEGDAGLAVERLGFLRDGRAVEFCRSIFRGDMYDFVAELSTP